MGVRAAGLRPGAVGRGGGNLVFGGPEPGDADVIAADHRVRPLDEQSLGAITGSITAPGSAFTAVVSTARATSCDQGQHDTWNDDGYDLRCVMSDTAVITGGSPPALVDDMGAVDARIHALAWVGQSNEDMAYPAQLPKVQYGPDASAMTRRQSVVLPTDAGVEVGWIQPDDEPGWSSAYSIDGKDRWRAADGRPVSQQDVVALTPSGSYLLTITVHRPYYEQ